MALSRGRSASRFSANIWPGFVDAMTALLMVLIFVITIFVVLQSVLRDTVDRQESQLDRLGDQVAGLSSTLSVTQSEKDAAQAGLTEAQTRILDFETQIARLAASRDAEAQRAGTAEAALGTARTEIDAAAEAARLAAARREALEALVKDLETQNTTAGQKLTEAEAFAEQRCVGVDVAGGDFQIERADDQFGEFRQEGGDGFGGGLGRHDGNDP